MIEDKKSLRQEIRRRRHGLDPRVVAYKSKCIFERAIELIRKERVNTILSFAGLPGEPDTRSLLQAILSDDRILILPRVEDENLRFFCIRDLENQLCPSPPYNILEPIPERCEEWNQKAIDLALVPGMAFDIGGNRLGHGGGYFDRALSILAPRPVLYGLAFEFQMRRAIPHEPHDVRMDGVITDHHFFHYQSSAIKTISPEETLQLGRNLAPLLEGDNILALEGPLGCGKTVFVQGLALGLDIQNDIVSQTFTLAKEYRSDSGVLWHADLYRLREGQEIDMEFWSEILEAPGIKAIEWSDRLGDRMPLDAIVASGTIEGDNERTWRITTPLENQAPIHNVAQPGR